MSDLNAANFLNELLKTKNQIKKHEIKTISVTEQVCGKTRHTFDHCEVIVKEYKTTHDYMKHAEVVNTWIEKATEIHFSLEKIKNLPEVTHLARKEIINISEQSIVSSTTLSVNASTSWTATKSRTISTGTSKNISGSIGIPSVGSAGINLSWTNSLTLASSHTEGESKSITKSSTETVSVKPWSHIVVELFVYDVEVEIPFTASVTLDADVELNSSGIYKASDVLSEAERTIDFTGTLRIKDCSDSFLRVRELGKIDKGVERHTLNVIEHEQFSFVNNEINMKPLSVFGLEKSVNMTRDQSGNIIFNEFKNPDGISYTVLYTTKSYAPSVACGFNDIGSPNLGIFNVEARQYYMHSNGVLVNQWQELVELFEGCSQV